MKTQNQRLLEILFLLSALACFSVAHAAPQPKLIVAIVVDQYSADVFNEYRWLYTEGLARLAGGAVFPNAYQGHASTETCPGHSTLLTGARPARTGIIANDWKDPRLWTAGEKDTSNVYCAEKTVDGKKVISPDTLLVPTLGDLLKDRYSAARVVAVSGKDRSAVMLGGHKADLTMWWSEDGYVTYPGQQAAIPLSISDTDPKRKPESINTRVRKSYVSDTPKPKWPEVCASRVHEIRVTDDIRIGIPQGIKGNSKRWRATPAMDAFTVDAALAAVRDLDLGRDEIPDLLAISLSGTDYVGHYYGTQGPEMCAQQIALDATIGRLLDELDRLKKPYIVVLTADHGGADATERNREKGIAAERVDVSLQPATMSAKLAKELQLPEPVLLGGKEFGSDVYLSPAVPADRREAVLHVAWLQYRRHPLVEAVFTRNELIAATPPDGPVDEWTLLERAKASFHPDRSGDLIVLLKPYVSVYPTPTNVDADYVSAHGSPWNYDRRVPIVFWWKGIQPFQQPAAVETVDIAPTLAGLIGLEMPAQSMDGRVLTIQPID